MNESTCTCNTNPTTCPIHDYIPPERHAEFAPMRETDQVDLGKTGSDWWTTERSGSFQKGLTYRRLKPTIEQERDELRAQLEQLQSEAAVMRMILMLWACTFQKYESWKANEVFPSMWPNQVLKDYKQLEEVTSKCLSTTAGKELLEKYQALEKRGDEQCARAIAAEQEAEHQHCMLETLKLDYSNLVSANKVMSDKLTDQIQICVERVEKLKADLNMFKHADGCFCEASFSGADGSHPRHSDECIIVSKALKP